MIDTNFYLGRKSDNFFRQFTAAEPESVCLLRNELKHRDPSGFNDAFDQSHAYTALIMPLLVSVVLGKLYP